uniref:Uncharacterized protein n=1 Tax=Ornithorhynchus anatinus TaxID=9258 RepID=A0A6I8NK06_ORNAN
MFAVGVGKAVEEELREIASDPVERHVSYAADFGALTRLLDHLKLDTCPASQRPGTCPPDNIRCIQAEADQCQDDSNCPGNQKCCHYQCGMKCKDPQGTTDSQKVKAVQDPLVTVWPGITDGKKGQSKDVVKKGSCPVVNIRCAMLNPPNHCLKDSECPAEKKCCEGACGKACVTPENNVVKKGSCPVVNIRCAMLNPPNRCLTDSECPAEKKCCEGGCGKDCVTPEKN